MKKLLAFAFIAVGFAACNNDANNNENADSLALTPDTAVAVETTPAPTITYNEGDISRRDGRVSTYQNGNWVPVEKDVVLDDGTVVTVNGEARNKDGRVYVIEDGYYVTRAGRFFDRTGAAIENAWEATKEGVSNAAEAVKDGANKVGDHLQQRHEQKVEDLNRATGN